MLDDQADNPRLLAERRCVLAMKSLFDAADVAEEVSAKEFPGEAPVQLCTLLAQVAKKAAERAPKLAADEPQHAVSQAELLSLLARRIVEHVRYAERAVTLETPWSIVETVAEFGQRLYGSKVSFIVRPKWSYNYSLVGEFTGYYLDKLQTLFPKASRLELVGDHPPIYAISFPRLEKSNSLLHACFAHELGHFVSGKWVSDKLPQSGFLDELKSLLLSHIKQDTSDPVEVATRLSNLQSKAHIALKRGLDELLADVAAVLLFGPSVLFALCHIATKGALAEVPSDTNEYYPPWGYRLHQVLTLCDHDVFSEAAIILEAGGFQGARCHVARFIQEIREFIGAKEDALDLEAWPVATRCAYQILEKELPQLVAWVRDSITSLKYSPSAGDLAQLCQDIGAGLPPLLTQGGHDVPTDFRDILNAGWLYLVTQIPETASCLTDDAAKYRMDRKKLDLLVLKAVESSYLLKHHVPPPPRP